MRLVTRFGPDYPLRKENDFTIDRRDDLSKLRRPR